MFVPVLDVFALKRLEKQLARSLTYQERELLRYREPLLCEFPNGDIREVRIDSFGLHSLMPKNVDIDECIKRDSEYQNGKARADYLNRKIVKSKKLSPDQLKSNSVARKILASTPGIEPIDEYGNIQRQVFKQRIEIDAHFERLSNVIHTFKFKKPAHEYIMYRYAEGASDRDISKFLRSPENTQFKQLGHVQVGKIRKQILRMMGIEPIEFNK